ncbi:unnamed protein product [Larinioides sclopetarius]|uniref:Uncharacterized protein n=1 Tax=Larinioides sclopetarius TaxID=280406 RepID=A0AAV2AX81_9ARAC
MPYWISLQWARREGIVEMSLVGQCAAEKVNLKGNLTERRNTNEMEKKWRVEEGSNVAMPYWVSLQWSSKIKDGGYILAWSVCGGEG